MIYKIRDAVSVRVDAIVSFCLKLRILHGIIADGFKTWKENVYQHDLDDYWCCDGKECMCGGETMRDVHFGKN